MFYNGDGSDGILESLLRNPTDLYYGAVALGALAFLVRQAGQGAMEDARALDERGDLTNKLAAENLRRERAARREKVKVNDVAYERLQAEAGQRADKRSRWKVFDTPEWFPSKQDDAGP